MKKRVIHKFHRELYALINLRLPVFVLRGVDVDSLIRCLNTPDNRQPWERRSLKGHCPPDGGKIPDYIEPDGIVAFLQIRSNIKSIIVPDPWTAPRRTNRHGFSINKQPISRIRREMQHRTRRQAGE